MRRTIALKGCWSPGGTWLLRVLAPAGLLLYPFLNQQAPTARGINKALCVSCCRPHRFLSPWKQPVETVKPKGRDYDLHEG